MSMFVTLPADEFQRLLDAAGRVPDLERKLNDLQRSYDGLRLLYSEILEALRQK